MNFVDAPDEARFRADLRDWLRDNMPDKPYPGRHGKEGNEFAMAWHRTLYAGGWLGLSWPKEYGGRGLGPLYDAIVNDEVGAAGGPTVPSVGFLGRAILHFGTPEQCERFLSPMLRGEVQWCQGFSEPGGIRPGVADDQGRTARRQLCGLWTEGVDQPGPVVRLVPAAVSNSRRPPAAQGAFLSGVRNGASGDHRTTVTPDMGLGPIQ